MTVKSLTAITDAELLAEVKKGINLQGNDYQDETITVWINEVKQYLLFAGVLAEVVGSTLAVGCIARGVDDYWASHRETFSEMFYQGVDRLRNITVEEASA